MFSFTANLVRIHVRMVGFVRTIRRVTLVSVPRLSLLSIRDDCFCSQVKYSRSSNVSLADNRHVQYTFNCLQGTHCESPVNFCDNHKCQNGGSCVIDYARSVGYKCQCRKGFMGTYCQKDPYALIKCPNTWVQCLMVPTSMSHVPALPLGSLLNDQLSIRNNQMP